jgi:hypothetical protein
MLPAALSSTAAAQASSAQSMARTRIKDTHGGSVWRAMPAGTAEVPAKAKSGKRLLTSLPPHVTT